MKITYYYILYKQFEIKLLRNIEKMIKIIIIITQSLNILYYNECFYFYFKD